jgi:integrase
VPGHTNLYRRAGGSFYFLRRVPTKLLPAYGGRKFIKISLRTSDPAEARRLARLKAAEVQAELDEAERKTVRPIRETATEAELIAIVGRWFYAVERRAAGDRSWTTDLGQDEVSRLIGESMEAEAAFEGEAGEGDVARLACALMEKHRLKLRGVEWRMMFELVRRAMVEHEKRQQERFAGRTVAVSFDPVFASVGAMSPPPAPVKPLDFDALLEGWKVERRPPEKTVADFKRALSRLAAHVGHTDPRRVTKAEIAGWKAVLLGEGRSEGTVMNHLVAVQSIFGVAARADLLPVNPAADVSMPAKKNGAKTRRLPFTDDEAKMILTAARGQRGYRKWIPWVLAYSGARLEEVAQALTTDVRQEDDVWVLSISADSTKTLKNEGSARLIPLHLALIAEGFLDYVRGLKAGPLFPDAAPDRFGRRGGNATKALGRWLRVNLDITDPRKVAGHSWRHRFKDLCRRFGVPKDIHDRLTGHAAGDAGSAYGLGFQVATLAEAIGKLPVQCPPTGRELDLD